MNTYLFRYIRPSDHNPTVERIMAALTASATRDLSASTITFPAIATNDADLSPQPITGRVMMAKVTQHPHEVVFEMELSGPISKHYKTASGTFREGATRPGGLTLKR